MRLIYVLAILTLSTLTLTACVDETVETPDVTPDATGKIIMPLVAESGGAVYRLNPARFRVQGAGINQVISGGELDTLDVDLAPGQYLVTLLDDWQLSVNESGGQTEIEAVLQSSNPQTLVILQGEVTDLVFRFGVGPDAIAFGQGRGRIGIEVSGGDCESRDWYVDADGDGFGDSSVVESACSVPDGFVANANDCDDTETRINPDAVEACNGHDDNCNLAIDEGGACTQRVFVTEGRYPSDFNGAGIFGADNICQGLADANRLRGDWVAWLSTSTTTAISRLNPLSGPFVRLDGEVVADNIADLVDGTLSASISINESGGNGSSSPQVWTGTTRNGTMTSSNCNDWTDTTGEYGIRAGLYAQTNPGWTDATATACNVLFSLYCFER